jgi:hypothetical protein
MKLINEIKAHPYLFGGLAGLPVIAQIAVFLCAWSPSSFDPSTIPLPYWIAAYACLPICSVVIGMFVAFALTAVNKRFRYSAGKLAGFYAACFVASWLVLYGCSSFFGFVMCLGAPPTPVSMDGFYERIIMLVVNYAYSVVASIAVCSGLTAVIIVIGEFVTGALAHLGSKSDS